MPSFFPFGKAGGLQILRWQVFAVKYYGFTLAALTLEPSDFCNNGVKPPEKEELALCAMAHVIPMLDGRY
jgi:hypothetical protein